jgi:hypothetical protein
VHSELKGIPKKGNFSITDTSAEVSSAWSQINCGQGEKAGTVRAGGCQSSDTQSCAGSQARVSTELYSTVHTELSNVGLHRGHKGLTICRGSVPHSDPLFWPPVLPVRVALCLLSPESFANRDHGATHREGMRATYAIQHNQPPNLPSQSQQMRTACGPSPNSSPGATVPSTFPGTCQEPGHIYFLKYLSFPKVKSVTILSSSFLKCVVCYCYI